MTTPIAFDAVVAAFLATYKGAPAIAGGNIYEAGTIDTVPAEVSQALVVGLDNALPKEMVLSGNSPIVWTTVVRVDHLVRSDVRGGDGSLPSANLFAAAHARLQTNPQLGGAAEGFELLRVLADREQADTTLGALSAFYRVTHRSTNDTLLPAN